MQGNGVHHRADFLHQHIGPLIVIIGGTAGNLKELCAVVIAAVGLVTAENIRVVLGQHVASATPGLITYTYIFNVPGLLTAVLLAQFGHRTVGGVHILDPLGSLLN